MGCVAFWLDNPISALENIKSIIPRPGQCIDEKLNALSLFVILFTIVLAVAKVKYFWVFGAVGLSIIVAVKLIWFRGKKGKASIEQYMSGAIDVDDIDDYVGTEDSEIYDSEELDEEKYHTPVYEDDLATRPYLDNNGDDWWEMKDRVGQQIAHARFPSMTHGCYNDNNCYY